MITISAFKWVPEFAQGQVRDLRARWALEEAGLPYKTRLLELGDQDKPDYRALQPFGQVPILEEDGLVLFESGAIVLHIGERSEKLLPKDAGARARAMQWLIAALNSIEPFVMNVALIDLFYENEEWAKLRRPGAVEFLQKRLSALSKSLGDKPYLDGDRFTAGDLMMTTVLRILQHTDIVTSEKRLAAYVERCTARPAFKRAFDAQIGDFRAGCLTRSDRCRDPAVVIHQTCKAKGRAMRKNTICLWYDKDAEAAARFYAATFPDSAVSAVLPCAQRLSRRKEGRRADSGIHGPRHTLSRPQRRSRVQAQRSLLVPDRDRRPGRDGPLLERNRREWRAGEPVRVVQGQVGNFLADHAARADRRACGRRR